MFEIGFEPDKTTVKDFIIKIVDHVSLFGFITKAEVWEMAYQGALAGPEDNSIGWTKNMIDDGREIFERYDPKKDRCIVVLKDPVPLKATPTGFDPVTKPSHYTEGRKYEPRKVIADWGLNFNLGNAVKYIARAGRKTNTVEDLKKAIRYIEFEIEELEGKNE